MSDRTVEETLFSIECPTCQRRLSVRSESAIGAILTCPKCESMVQVVPPPGWQSKPKAPPAEVVTAPVAAAAPVLASAGETLTPGDAAAGGAHLAAAVPTAPPAMFPSGAESLPPVAPWAAWLPWNWPVWASLCAAAAVLAGVVGLSAWGLSGRSNATPVAIEPNGASTAMEPAESGAAPAEAATPPWDPRWTPNATRLIFRVPVGEPAASDDFDKRLGPCTAAWRPSVGRLLGSFRIKPQNVRSITWASPDLKAWTEQAVATIEFEPTAELEMFHRLGSAAGFSLAGVPCRELPGEPWPHPFAAIDARTLVTGPAALLRELADRQAPLFSSPAIARLVPLLGRDDPLFVAVDLAAAREAGWPLPVSAMDVWPAGRDGWRTAWQSAQGACASLGGGPQSPARLAMVCESETSAEAIRTAVSGLATAGRAWSAQRGRTLGDDTRSGKLSAAQAERYVALLAALDAALGAAKIEAAERIVTLQVDLAAHRAALASLAENEHAARTDWWAAARLADEALQRRLQAGLAAYRKAEGHLPAGTSGGALFAPETRLSWVAALLPYLGHADWHKQLNAGYSWNSPQNRPVTQRPLDDVVNPALGPFNTEAGFPVSHYVGVAGVGADAAALKPGDPRAGVFGFDRRTRPEDIRDGASNTIATMGVQGNLGAWASGGSPTVRGLTQKPYVNGPDGFGTGQPHGMLVGMADGSVRFLSKNTDPRVIEQMATAAGGESVDLAKLPAEGPVFEPDRAGAAPQAVVGPVAPKSPPEEVAVAKRPPAKSAKAKPDPKDPKADLLMEADEGDDEAAAKAPEAEAAPDRADVAARLKDPLAEVQWPETTLVDAIRLLGQLGGVPVTWDLDALAESGVGLNDPVAVQLHDTTLGAALEAVLAQRKMAYLASENDLLVTRPGRKAGSMRQMKYPLSDLIDAQSPADALVAMIPRLVSPESWRSAGGQGELKLTDGTLAVLQGDRVQYEVGALLDKLRLARGLSPLVDPKRDRGFLATRWDAARAALRRPVTLNFPDKTPLARILLDLEDAAKTRLCIDRVALRAAGISPTAPATLRVVERPLSEALGQLLGPLELGFRMVGPDVLEITTKKATQSRLDLEFYDVKSALAALAALAAPAAPAALAALAAPTSSAPPLAPEALIERIKSDVAGATWNDAGGSGVLWFDKRSGHLLVLQTQPLQTRIQLLLAKLAAKPAAAPAGK